MSTTTITARTPSQQDALHWMMGKALPETGVEGLPLDEEWGTVVVSDVTDYHKSLTSEVVLRTEHVETFLSECEDGARILKRIAHDWNDPATRGAARALENLVRRVRDEVSGREGEA